MSAVQGLFPPPAMALRLEAMPQYFDHSSPFTYHQAKCVGLHFRREGGLNSLCESETCACPCVLWDRGTFSNCAMPHPKNDAGFGLGERERMQYRAGGGGEGEGWAWPTSRYF